MYDGGYNAPAAVGALCGARAGGYEVSDGAIADRNHLRGKVWRAKGYALGSQ